MHFCLGRASTKCSQHPGLENEFSATPRGQGQLDRAPLQTVLVSRVLSPLPKKGGPGGGLTKDWPGRVGDEGLGIPGSLKTRVRSSDPA